ncbi:MAG: elongation factor G [Planctomycetota bacterium]
MARTIRNIGIIAHIDAGKTTVSERFLYYAGREHRMGEVHEGTARMDWLQEEQERGITITSAATSFSWLDATVNLIDTPGHVDFTAEVERSLRVLDGAVGVFCGVAGVQAQSETVWRQANTYRVPRIAFVNKLDRVGSDYFRVVDNVADSFHCVTLPMVVPIGAEGDFEGVIDLVRLKELRYDEGALGASVIESEICPSRREVVDLWRSELLERVADGSDEIAELFLEGSPVPTEVLVAAIRKGTIEHRWVPVFGGAAFRNKGIQLLLDAVVHYLPAPEDIVAVSGTDPDGERQLTRPLNADQPLAALVFKVQVDQHTELYYTRVYSGIMRRGEACLNPRGSRKERLATIYRMHANQREAVEEARAGDIVALTGLRFSVTGDTLCDPKHPIVLERLEFPETVVAMAIEPRSASERERLLEQLERLAKEDPTFKVHQDPETGQVIMSGMGELHLEVIRNRLVRDFKVDAKIGKPRVSYRQSFVGPARRSAEVERLVGGKEQRGTVDLELLPDASLRGVEVEWLDAGGISKEWKESLTGSLQALAASGGSLAFPFVQVRFRVRIPPITPETTELGLSLAIREAFNDLEAAAGTVLLEPVMRFQVTTPEEYFGGIHQDLIRHRATVESVDMQLDLRRLSGTVPLAEVFGYTTTLRSLSQGRASMSLEPMGYAPAPDRVAERFRL